MPFVGCLIVLWGWLTVNFTGSKCGKGKSIEVFEFAVSLHLWALRVQTCFVAEGQHFVVVETLAET